MKSRILFILAMLCLLANSLIAQTISNVQWELDETQKKIIITYNLEKEGKYSHFDINIKVKVGDLSIDPRALEGDVGSFVRVGPGKRVVWSVLDDVDTLKGNLKVIVVASNPIPIENHTNPNVEVESDPRPKPQVPAWAGISGLAATGLGLLTAGILNESEAMDYYKVYQSIRNPTDSAYDELSREDHFEAAANQHKKGTLLMAAGGGVLTAGAAIFINRLLKNKKQKEHQRLFSRSSQFYSTVYPHIGGQSVGMGINISF